MHNCCVMHKRIQQCLSPADHSDHIQHPDQLLVLSQKVHIQLVLASVKSLEIPDE